MTPNLPTGAQVDALGQFPRTVTLDLYPGKEGPEPGVLPRPMSAFQIYAREVSACTESFAPPRAPCCYLCCRRPAAHAQTNKHANWKRRDAQDRPPLKN